MKFILGKKIGMSQIFKENGKVVPVTVIEAGPCIITQVKTKEKDGYTAVQIGFGEIKKMKKPQNGHLNKVQSSKLKVQNYGRWLREFRIEYDALNKLGYKVGDLIKVDSFKKGGKIVVSGISKGKGFQGVIKRHGFSRGPESHGSDHHREPGSIGSAFPQRVIKGRKLPGRTGGSKVTISNLEIIQINKESNTIYVKGAVPGAINGLLLIEGI